VGGSIQGSLTDCELLLNVQNRQTALFSATQTKKVSALYTNLILVNLFSFPLFHISKILCCLSFFSFQFPFLCRKFSINIICSYFVCVYVSIV
jgi:hypothetical protein